MLLTEEYVESGDYVAVFRRVIGEFWLWSRQVNAFSTDAFNFLDVCLNTQHQPPAAFDKTTAEEALQTLSDRTKAMLRVVTSLKKRTHDAEFAAVF